MRKIVFLWVGFCAVGFVGEAIAQHKLFAVSGQGRGSEADSRQAAQIGKLETENVDRKAETTQNASDIADNEARISNNESELATIQPHAKAPQQSCSVGELIRWDGASYTCVSEDDPTVGPHALTTTVPPDCHDTNAKLLWRASTQQWHCEQDMNDGSGGGWTGAEDDPQVGTLYNGRLCRSDGTQVICDSLAPQVVGNGISVAGNVQVGGTVAGTDATFTGNVAGATPTASNHLATKDYVDAATAGAAGGGGSGFMCGTTRAKYNGNLGGLAGADAKCAAEFGTGWRFATIGNWGAGARSLAYVESRVLVPGRSDCNDWTTSNPAWSSMFLQVRVEISGSIPIYTYSSGRCDTMSTLACCNF